MGIITGGCVSLLSRRATAQICCQMSQMKIILKGEVWGDKEFAHGDCVPKGNVQEGNA